jgi:CBS domain-containing protein
MRIADVLATKPKGVVTLWTNHTLAEALRLMDERSVSSVVIVDPERRPLGLLTDRDAVHALAAHGPTALEMGVTHLMSAPPPYCTPDTTVSQALARMTADRVRHLVVVGEEIMLGVVSIGDLVKVRLDDAAIEGNVLRDIALGRIAATG